VAVNGFGTEIKSTKWSNAASQTSLALRQIEQRIYYFSKIAIWHIIFENASDKRKNTFSLPLAE